MSDPKELTSAEIAEAARPAEATEAAADVAADVASDAVEPPAGPETAAAPDEGAIAPAEPAVAGPTAAPAAELAPTAPAGEPRPAPEPAPAPDAAVAAAAMADEEPATPGEELEFTPLPGTPAAMPEVQAARAEAEAARAALGREIATLKVVGSETFDVKRQVSRVPRAIAADPRKLAATGAAIGGSVLLVARSIRGRGRGKAMPPGMLPAEVEEAFAGLGDDAGRVREALNDSFTRYLVDSGGQAQKRRRRVPGFATLFLLPVASTVTREGIKLFARRVVQGPPADEGPPAKQDPPAKD